MDAFCGERAVHRAFSVALNASVVHVNVLFY